MPYVNIDNTLRIHYIDEGMGPTLFLLHGLGNNSQSWRRQIEALKNQFRVIAWDAPGYGKSSDPESELRHFSQFAEILNKVVEELSLTEIYLLGHSMGSAIATEFCFHYPKTIKGLILASATRGGSVLAPEENERRLQARLKLIDTLTPEELAKERTKHLLAPNPDPAVLEEAERIMAQVRPKGYRSVSYCLYNAEVDNKYSTIDVPTLLICGELDTVTPVSESKIIQSKIKGAKLEIISGAGHLCYQEKPEQFNELIRQFINNLE